MYPASGRNRINVLDAVNAVSKEVTTLINTIYIVHKRIEIKSITFAGN
jgi:hypothetical protein